MLRAALGLQRSEGGVLVGAAHPLGAAAASGVLPGDVLLAFDGSPIAPDGSVALKGGDRVAFDHLVSLKGEGEEGRLLVLRPREGVRNVVVFPAPVPELVPRHLYDQKDPSYLVLAGLVLLPLSQPFLADAYGDEWASDAPRALVDAAVRGEASRIGQQVVVLGQVLWDEANAGYQSLVGRAVLAVNGLPVLNLRHLRHLLYRESKRSSPFVFLALEGDAVAAIDLQSAAASTDRIMTRHRLPALESLELAEAPSLEELRAWSEAETLKGPLPWLATPVLR